MSVITLDAPFVTLAGSNLNVVNFSSPHPFDFENGQVLAACSEERSKALSMGSNDVTTERVLPNGKTLEVVTKRFVLTDECRDELYRLQNDVNVDVILVPFPTLQCVQELGLMGSLDKVATIFLVDRIKKLISTRRFCR